MSKETNVVLIAGNAITAPVCQSGENDNYRDGGVRMYWNVWNLFLSSLWLLSLAGDNCY